MVTNITTFIHYYWYLPNLLHQLLLDRLTANVRFLLIHKIVVIVSYKTKHLNISIS